MKIKINYLFPSILFFCAFYGHRLNAEILSSFSEMKQGQNISDSETQKGTQRLHMFDPNAMPNSHGLWLDGELLFWKANMGSLEYGIDSDSPNSIKDGHVKHPHFEWDLGFRLGLGCKLPHDKWDLFVNYTHVHGHAKGHAGGGDDIVFPTWASASGFSGESFYANEAKAHWKTHLNMADLELGRNCFASKWLSIRPFIGVRGLVIDQDYTVKYFGGTVAPLDEDKVVLNTDFWGVGLRAGFDSLWGLGRGFGIYGNGSASLLAADFDVHEKEKLKKADLRRLDIKSDVDNVVTTADLALGLQWDYLFSQDHFHFGIKFGWEFNIFFDQNQLFNFLSSKDPRVLNFKKDDLTFHGLTLGIRFDF